jgi:hypothetical protein
VASVVSVAGFQNYTNTTMAPQASKPSNNSAYAEGLSKTNPNTPQVDLPLFIWELKDIPRMLKAWGDALYSKPTFSAGKNLNSLPKAVASRYLEYQFGIAPFLSDLAKILDFQAQVQKKLDQLDRLDKPGGSVRSGTVYKDEYIHSFVHGPNYATSLYQEGRQVWHQDTVARKMWVSTKWVPQVTIPRTADDRRSLATRLAFGLDISFSLLWEAMPWSWLFDWFSNVGDLLNLTRNILPVKFSDSCLMDYTVLRRLLHHVSFGAGSSLQIEMPKFLYEEKLRTPMGSGLPQIEFGVPFLNGTQVAILSALTVLKGIR